MMQLDTFIQQQTALRQQCTYKAVKRPWESKRARTAACKEMKAHRDRYHQELLSQNSRLKERAASSRTLASFTYDASSSALEDVSALLQSGGWFDSLVDAFDEFMEWLVRAWKEAWNTLKEFANKVLDTVQHSHPKANPNPNPTRCSTQCSSSGAH